MYLLGFTDIYNNIIFIINNLFCLTPDSCTICLYRGSYYWPPVVVKTDQVTWISDFGHLFYDREALSAHLSLTDLIFDLIFFWC